MKGWAIVALTIMLTVSIAVTASGQIDVPNDVESIIPIYPGAEVILSRDGDGGSQMIIETRDDPKAVVIFFRKALTYKGWSIVSKIAFEKRAFIVFSKANRVLQFAAHDVDEHKTKVIVSITD